MVVFAVLLLAAVRWLPTN